MPQPKGGVIERLTAVSRLPWTVSLGLAPVAFVVFHVIATATAPATATARTRSAAHLGDMGGVAMRAYAHIFAVALQFIVPAIFLAAGCASIVRRIRSRALLGDIRRGVYTDIATLSRQDFERMLSGAFRRRGYSVSGRGSSEAEGGIDMALVRNNERFLVQCKQWRAQSVSVSVVRELCEAMAAEGAVGGFAVTSGT